MTFFFPFSFSELLSGKAVLIYSHQHWLTLLISQHPKYYYLLKFYYYYNNLTGVYQALFTGLISFPLHYNPLKRPFGSLVSLEDWETKGSQMLRSFFFKQIEGNSCDSFYCSGLEPNLQYL